MNRARNKKTMTNKFSLQAQGPYMHNSAFITVLLGLSIPCNAYSQPKKRVFITVITDTQQLAQLNNANPTPSSLATKQDSSSSTRPISVVINTTPATASPTSHNVVTPGLTEHTKSDPNTDTLVTIHNNTIQKATLNNTTLLIPPSPSGNVAPSDQNALSRCNNFFKQLLSLCWNNKKMTLGISVATGYLVVLAALEYQKLLLKTQCFWAHWNIWGPSDDLTDLPANQLAEDLYMAIQQHYGSKECAYGFLSPVMYFLKDIERECTYINRLCVMCSWMKRSHISFLFPSQHAACANAEQMKKKLSYMKEVLLAWMHHDAEAARYRFSL